jgi:SAM-dependent methyltransferase
MRRKGNFTMGIISRAAARATAIPCSVQAHMFDRMFGVSTAVDSKFSVAGDNNAYDPSQWFPVRRALRKLSPGPQDVFADLGSGKGRVLLIAGRLPYGRVIGVDIDEELGRCAQENIRKAAARFLATEVTSLTASVLEWPVPDDLSVVYMFNPFMGETFRGAMERILDSHERRPRDLRIVYGFPAEHDWLLSTGRVVVEAVSPLFWLSRPGWWRRGEVFVTYRVIPASGEGSPQRVLRPPARPNRAFQHWSTPNGFRLVQTISDKGVLYVPASSRSPA